MRVGGTQSGRAVEEPKSRRIVAGYVEFNPGQAGQVTADPAFPERFAGDPPMCQVIQSHAGGGDNVRAVGGQCFDVVGDGGVGD